MAIVNLFDEQMTESAAEDLITDLRRKLAETTNALLASRAAKDIAVSAAYEQGKQAGAMKCCRELSEQEPVASVSEHYTLEGHKRMTAMLVEKVREYISAQDGYINGDTCCTRDDVIASNESEKRLSKATGELYSALSATEQQATQWLDNKFAEFILSEEVRDELTKYLVVNEKSGAWVSEKELDDALRRLAASKRKDQV